MRVAAVHEKAKQMRTPVPNAILMAFANVIYYCRLEVSSTVLELNGIVRCFPEQGFSILLILDSLVTLPNLLDLSILQLSAARPARKITETGCAAVVDAWLQHRSR